VGHAREITEELEATRGLRASEENLRLLTDNIREVFWVFDTGTFEVRYVSPAYEVVWGRSCESLRQAPRSWLDAVGSRSLVSGARRLRARATGGRPRGRLTTLVKTEERLRQAAKLDALGRVAGGVAHDFNNLLSVMLSYVELTLASPGLGAEQREDLGVVRDTGESAVALTRQLLTFSRQQVVEPRSIDLGRALTGMERMLRRLLREDIELVLGLASTTATVRLDPGHLEQVVMNLTINARDAMPRGGRGDVVVAAVRRSYPGIVLVAMSAYVKRIPLADGALVKPVRLPFLVSVVLELTG
jgi:signal transduction histidine kinase